MDSSYTYGSLNNTQNSYVTANMISQDFAKRVSEEVKIYKSSDKIENLQFIPIEEQKS